MSRSKLPGKKWVWQTLAGMEFLLDFKRESIRNIWSSQAAFPWHAMFWVWCISSSNAMGLRTLRRGTRDESVRKRPWDFQLNGEVANFSADAIIAMVFGWSFACFVGQKRSIWNYDPRNLPNNKIRPTISNDVCKEINKKSNQHHVSSLLSITFTLGEISNLTKPQLLRNHG